MNSKFSPTVEEALANAVYHRSYEPCKIVRAMRENGSPPPEFYNPETRSFMTVILPIHEAFKVDAQEKVSPHNAKTTEKTVVKTVVKPVVKPGSKSEGIVKNLKANPFATRKDLAEATGLSIRGVEWNLKTLTRAGVIRRVGPDKGGHWEVIGQA